MAELPFITPDWPAPARVKALVTTRAGGVSVAPWNSFNLGLHVGDDAQHVAENRRRLRAQLPAEPRWLDQVHGTSVWTCEQAGPASADALVTRLPAQVCAIMTADCLPVLFTNQAGTVVAAAHAGWRGLCAGVLERSLEAMQEPAGAVMAWLGPAIGPQQFEVGPEVRAAFIEQAAEAAEAFVPGAEDRYLADIYQLARQRLCAAGMRAEAIYGGGLCTVSEPQRFFSYRRDRVTGRMASLIWLDQGGD
ncbi:peptidoglycan editing factor PgeF [Uliginosibacterium sediminicola]|uniref:Purine nucleoside phosphorylase n=1 Tax=Uliginosibacterium sediminicola TaxID=2024550 RepID=A0ABU9Z148_9RHOO